MEWEKCGVIWVKSIILANRWPFVGFSTRYFNVMVNSEIVCI